MPAYGIWPTAGKLGAARIARHGGLHIFPDDGMLLPRLDPLRRAVGKAALLNELRLLLSGGGGVRGVGRPA